MKALTLWRPWSWAIAAGHKTVENRPWEPPRGFIGERFAIHSGMKWDDDGALSILRLIDLETFPDDPLVTAAGAVIAVATCVRVVQDRTFDHERSTKNLSNEEFRWFFGPFGWVLRDVVGLEPIPCRGFQMLWELPADVKAEVQRQLASRRQQ